MQTDFSVFLCIFIPLAIVVTDINSSLELTCTGKNYRLPVLVYKAMLKFVTNWSWSDYVYNESSLNDVSIRDVC